MKEALRLFLNLDLHCVSMIQFSQRSFITVSWFLDFHASNFRPGRSEKQLLHHKSTELWILKANTRELVVSNLGVYFLIYLLQLYSMAGGTLRAQVSPCFAWVKDTYCDHASVVRRKLMILRLRYWAKRLVGPNWTKSVILSSLKYLCNQMDLMLNVLHNALSQV